MKDLTLNDPAAAADHLANAKNDATSRRRALRTLGKLGLGAAVLSTGSFLLTPRAAYAQDGPSAVDILNFALTLEYLERSFYRQGTDSGVIPEEAMDVFELIQEHEEEHVEFLTGVVNSIEDGAAVSFEDDTFDFTAGNGSGDGPLNPFEDYAVFLTLAQGFEDTGVRAYKGQATNILGTAYLTPALQIHSLEARHAAEVRRLRKGEGVDVEPWIVLGSVMDDSPIAAVYGPGTPEEASPPEQNVTQPASGPIATDVTTLGDYSEEEASAAFDEPLDMTTVLSIADPFVPGDQGDSDS